jgi:hypothetical protein
VDVWWKVSDRKMKQMRLFVEGENCVWNVWKLWEKGRWKRFEANGLRSFEEVSQVVGRAT